mmetsp:Transcript_3915/g.7087  ORF Transcript_3915/g.7087 Transcript_3915/m.7087 type:complete len:145 (+) Transcript_3915:59-493(+)
MPREQQSYMYIHVYQHRNVMLVSNKAYKSAIIHPISSKTTISNPITSHHITSHSSYADLLCKFSCFHVLNVLTRSEGTKNIVTKNEPLAEVVVIVSVMDRVVLGSHDGLGVQRHRIMNIGCPDPREEKQENVSEVMHRNHGEKQ